MDVLRTIESATVQTCITSPPFFGLRDYGVIGQIGLESSPDEFTTKLVNVFREVRRVLRDDGTLWLNLGDSYSSTGETGRNDTDRGISPGLGKHQKSRRERRVKRRTALRSKNLIGIPWRVAFALQADGWYLRSDIIWAKPNPMPESVTDRPTKSHEYLFLLSKSERYFYNHDAIREPVKATAGKLGAGRHRTPRGSKFQAKVYARRKGANRRSVWTVATRPYKGAHFATFPPALIEPCVLAGSREGDLVLDPFNGAGTTGLVALQHRRRYLGIDLNADYLKLTRQRFKPLMSIFEEAA